MEAEVWARAAVEAAWGRAQATARATDLASALGSEQDSDLVSASAQAPVLVPQRAAPAHPSTAPSRYGVSTRR